LLMWISCGLPTNISERRGREVSCTRWNARDRIWWGRLRI